MQFWGFQCLWHAIQTHISFWLYYLFSLIGSVSKDSILVLFPSIITFKLQFSIFSTSVDTRSSPQLPLHTHPYLSCGGMCPHFLIFSLHPSLLHRSLSLSVCHCVRMYLRLNYSLENWRAIKKTGTMAGPVCICAPSQQNV